MSSQPTLRLIDRLRGKYVLPVDDGSGLLNGSDVFVREFPSPPIQKEAADHIEMIEEALKDVAEQRDYFMNETYRAAETIPDLVEVIRALVAVAPDGEAKERGRQVLRRMPGP